MSMQNLPELPRQFLFGKYWFFVRTWDGQDVMVVYIDGKEKYHFFSRSDPELKKFSPLTDKKFNSVKKPARPFLGTFNFGNYVVECDGQGVRFYYRGTDIFINFGFNAEPKVERNTQKK